MDQRTNEHGGALDAAIQKYGGTRAGWMDLSTGINPDSYPLVPFQGTDWTALPDQAQFADLCTAARRFWDVPKGADILPTAGCSAAIAAIAGLLPPAEVDIEPRTYNEHAAAFHHYGWRITAHNKQALARVRVHPNNPTGIFYSRVQRAKLSVIDESFCDVDPARSLIHHAAQTGYLVLKSFGKFWGLAGLRLGFVIGDPALIAVLKTRLGPWPVSSVALRLGAAALGDLEWAAQTRIALFERAKILDQILLPLGAVAMGECPLFRTYQLAQAQELHRKLARAHILTRVFSYDPTWIRFGLPKGSDIKRLRDALCC